jgi:hypothetical protein
MSQTELARWFRDNIDYEYGDGMAESFMQATANNDRLRDELLTVLVVQDTLATDT